MSLSIGEKVKLRVDIREGNQDLPLAVLARRGEVLEVVGVGEKVISVAHDWAIKEGKSFRLFHGEFDLVECSNGGIESGA